MAVISIVSDNKNLTNPYNLKIMRTENYLFEMIKKNLIAFLSGSKNCSLKHCYFVIRLSVKLTVFYSRLECSLSILNTRKLFNFFVNDKLDLIECNSMVFYLFDLKYFSFTRNLFVSAVIPCDREQ